jgi:hypothetical protein
VQQQHRRQKKCAWLDEARGGLRSPQRSGGQQRSNGDACSATCPSAKAECWPSEVRCTLASRASNKWCTTAASRSTAHHGELYSPVEVVSMVHRNERQVEESVLQHPSDATFGRLSVASKRQVHRLRSIKCAQLGAWLGLVARCKGKQQGKWLVAAASPRQARKTEKNWPSIASLGWVASLGWGGLARSVYGKGLEPTTSSSACNVGSGRRRAKC